MAALRGLWLWPHTVPLTTMALSLTLQQTPWFFCRGGSKRLLEQDERHLPASHRTLLAPVQAVVIVDATITRVSTTWQTVLPSVQHQAAATLTVRVSLRNLTVDTIQGTAGKRHDTRFSGITQQPGLLYLVDLGYWSFSRLTQMIAAASILVCRLTAGCAPRSVAVAQPRRASVIGKRRSEIRDLLSGDTVLAVTVQLSKATKPLISANIRLGGLRHDGVWRFWITPSVAPVFPPQIIDDRSRQRWAVAMFFHVVNHWLHSEHRIARHNNGIMVEIYAALSCSLLTQLVLRLAAQKTGTPVERFSFQMTSEYHIETH